MSARRDHVCPIVMALVLAPLRPSLVRAAETGSADSIAVLPVDIEGELAPTWRAQLQGRLEEGIARGGRPVVVPEGDARCADAACMIEVGRTLGARWIARARLTPRDRDFEVTVALFDARDGARVTETRATCEVCAIAEVGDMLADQAGILDRKLAALAQGPPVVRFESRPIGAMVWIDGEPVGAAPIERTVDAGRHRARAELDGYLPLELRFDAVAGTHDAVLLELSAAPPPPRRPLRAAGWATFGIGLGLVGVGVPLLVVDGRPYTRRCDGDDVDGDGDCRFRHDTRTGGAVALGVGVAAVVTGIVLVAIAKRRARRAKAVARAAPGGLTWAF